MKNALLLTFLILSSVFVNAQKLKFTKTEILFDGEVGLKVERDWGAEVVKIFDLDKNLIVSMAYKQSYDDYIEFYFVKADREFSSSQLSGYFYKGIVKRLVQDGVLSKSGEVDPEKLEVFIKTYD